MSLWWAFQTENKNKQSEFFIRNQNRFPVKLGSDLWGCRQNVSFLVISVCVVVKIKNVLDDYQFPESKESSHDFSASDSVVNSSHATDCKAWGWSRFKYEVCSVDSPFSSRQMLLLRITENKLSVCLINRSNKLHQFPPFFHCVWWAHMNNYQQKDKKKSSDKSTHEKQNIMSEWLAFFYIYNIFNICRYTQKSFTLSCSIWFTIQILE